MLKRIIILLNLALVFLISCISNRGSFDNGRVRGGFQECQIYEYFFNNGDLDTTTKILHSKIKYDRGGYKIIQNPNILFLVIHNNAVQGNLFQILGYNKYLNGKIICNIETNIDRYDNISELIWYACDGSSKWPIKSYKYIYSK